MKTTKTLFITLICSFIFSLTTPSSIAFANHTLITSNVYAASTDATPPEISPACHLRVMCYHDNRLPEFLINVGQCRNNLFG